MDSKQVLDIDEIIDSNALLRELEWYYYKISLEV